MNSPTSKKRKTFQNHVGCTTSHPEILIFSHSDKESLSRSIHHKHWKLSHLPAKQRLNHSRLSWRLAGLNLASLSQTSLPMRVWAHRLKAVISTVPENDKPHFRQAEMEGLPLPDLSECTPVQARSFTYHSLHLKNREGLNSCLGLYFGERRSIENTHMHMKDCICFTSCWVYLVISIASPFVVFGRINSNFYILNCPLLLCYETKCSS